MIKKYPDYLFWSVKTKLAAHKFGIFVTNKYLIKFLIFIF